MLRRVAAIGWVLTLAMGLAGCVRHAEQRCVSDSECRSARVCGAAGWCIEPDSNPGADAGDTELDGDGATREDADAATPSPDLVVRPDELVFPLPDASARQRIEWKILRLKNRGSRPLALESVEVPDSDSFTLRYPREDSEDPDAESPVPPAEIAAGETVRMRVWYRTEDARDETATIEIRSNDPDSPVTRVPLVANPNPPCIEFPEGREVVVEPSTSDPDEPYSFSFRNCSGTHELLISDLRLEQDGGGALALDFDAIAPSSFPWRLASGAALEIPIDVVTSDDDWNRGVVVIDSNDPYRPRTAVDILRDSAGNDCPVASVDAYRADSDFPITDNRQIEPGTTVELDGTRSADPDGEIVEYQWTMLESPSGSGQFLPSPSEPRTTVTLDQPGTYLAELVVVDDQGARDCAAPGQVRLVATRNDIRIELEWRTPGDPDPNDEVGANVDLHYLHPNGRWNEAPWDIWEEHPTEDWSRIQRPDTPPEMLEATQVGPGREVIYHATPEFDHEFLVGAYYVDDAGFGPSWVTVRLITDDQVVWESPEVLLGSPERFYEAAHFAMPGPEIIEVDQLSREFPLR